MSLSMQFWDNQQAPRANTLRLILSFALVVAAFFSPYFVGEVDVSKFGNCEDVPEALLRDKYVAQKLLPHQWQVFTLHAAAFLVLGFISSSRRIGVIGVIIWASWVLSFGIHLFSFFVLSLFAI